MLGLEGQVGGVHELLDFQAAAAAAAAKQLHVAGASSMHRVLLGLATANFAVLAVEPFCAGMSADELFLDAPKGV